jgi:membrane-associated phospholipid phosphatase
LTEGRRSAEVVSALLAVARKLRGLQPELVVAAPFVAVFVAGLALGLPLNAPDRTSLSFVERHYFRPLLAAVVLQALVLWLPGQAGRSRLDRRTIGWLLGLVTASILVHFNFKAWMPLVHRNLFDLELGRTDMVFGDLVPELIAVRRSIASFLLAHAGFDVDPLYHFVFVAMFFASFSAHAVFDTALGLRKVVLGACLVLLLGGMLYWILPAEGPFLTRVVEGNAAPRAQRAMKEMFETVLATNRFPRGYFVAPLAAMPSLHTAHAAIFCLYARRRVPWLGVAFYPALLWILIEAVATGWHYVLDLAAGALLAVFCVWAIDWLLPEPPAVAPARGAA